MSCCLTLWETPSIHAPGKKEESFSHGENNDNWRRRSSLHPTSAAWQSHNEPVHIFHGIQSFNLLLKQMASRKTSSNPRESGDPSGRCFSFFLVPVLSFLRISVQSTGIFG